MTRTRATSARSAPLVHQVDHGAHLSYRRLRASFGCRGNALEQLTNDHRVVVSSQQSYLSRALGVNPQVEIDYQTLRLEPGDIFVLATDGVYEHVGRAVIIAGDQRGNARRSRCSRESDRR